jgi:4-hydroxy-3-polyprenylbenzoate decarboxylase
MDGRRGGSGDLILGISGASGSRLGLRALQLFSGSPDVERLHLVVSPRALLVARTELDAGIASVEALVDAARLDAPARAKITLHKESAVDASISSGSFRTRGMAILPCSAGTLASIAHGTSRGLLQRAADVCLKERRRLVLGLRETPLSLVHAENIVSVTRAGGIVAPVVPAFYAARGADDLLDAYLLRVADLLDVRVATEDYRWTGDA